MGADPGPAFARADRRRLRPGASPQAQGSAGGGLGKAEKLRSPGSVESGASEGAKSSRRTADTMTVMAKNSASSARLARIFVRIGALRRFHTLTKKTADLPV